MHDFDNIRLRSHHRVNGLVGCRGLVDHVAIFPAFYAFGHANVVFHGKPSPCLIARHRAACAMTAAFEAFRITPTSNSNWCESRAVAFAAGGTAVILLVLNAVMGLRVKPEEERSGLDLSQHSESAYAFSAGEYDESI